MPTFPRKHPRLRVLVKPIPTEDALRAEDEALDAFAEAMADRLIANARAEVAAELGLDPDAIDRERDRVSPFDAESSGPLGALS